MLCLLLANSSPEGTLATLHQEVTNIILCPLIAESSSEDTLVTPQGQQVTGLIWGSRYTTLEKVQNTTLEEVQKFKQLTTEGQQLMNCLAYLDFKSPIPYALVNRLLGLSQKKLDRVAAELSSLSLMCVVSTSDGQQGLQATCSVQAFFETYKDCRS